MEKKNIILAQQGNTRKKNLILRGSGLCKKCTVCTLQTPLTMPHDCGPQSSDSRGTPRSGRTSRRRRRPAGPRQWRCWTAAGFSARCGGDSTAGEWYRKRHGTSCRAIKLGQFGSDKLCIQPPRDISSEFKKNRHQNGQPFTTGTPIVGPGDKWGFLLFLGVGIGLRLSLRKDWG